MKLQEITPSIAVLLVGGILAIFVQMPIINELLPMTTYNFGNVDGGINLMGTYDIPSGFEPNGWTMIGLPGLIWWLLLLIAGMLCIIPAVSKFQPFLPEMELPIPGGLPFLLAIIGGAIQLMVTLLIFIGDDQDFDAYGMSMLDIQTPNFAVGLGFYVMLIAAIVSLVGAILLYLEEAAA